MSEKHGLNRPDYHGNIDVGGAVNSTALTLTAAFALILSSASPVPAQQLGQKQATTSGHVVTVYSISWPTPVSSVAADVEVCAGSNAPANSFAFPSFFQVHFA